MQLDDDDAEPVWELVVAAKRLRDILVGVTHARFDADEVLRLAVERLLANIGEAAHRVSPEFQDAHQEIPWHEIIGQRNVLVHEYGTVDDRLVWETAASDVPQLITQLERILPAIDDAAD